MPPLPKERGSLVKRALISGRNWKKRFFVLNGLDSKLAYWRRESEYRDRWEPQGRFDLASRVTCKVGGSSLLLLLLLPPPPPLAAPALRRQR